MNVTIRTRYHGATDTDGARITATGLGESLTVPVDYAEPDPHRAAAEALATSIISNAPSTITRTGEYGQTGYYWKATTR